MSKQKNRTYEDYIEKGELLSECMPFTQWLASQRDRNDAIGDLARDAAYDGFPTELNTRETGLRYLERCGACWNAIDTYKRAYATFEARARVSQS